MTYGDTTFARWIAGHGNDAQVAAFFAALGLLLAAERLWPRRDVAAERRGRWAANFGLTFLNFIAFGLLPVSLIGAAAWAQGRGLGLLHQVSLPLWALVAANLLLRGFISFFTHLLMHKVPLFWRVHRVHHTDTGLDASTTVRFHPLEFAVALLPGVPLAVAFGLTPWILLAYEVVDAVVTVFSHANLRLPPALERVVRYLVVTPDLHRIHHSSWQPETDSNFGAVFPIWDLVFGTFRPEPRDGHERMRLGLDEWRGPETRRIGWLLASPLRSRPATPAAAGRPPQTNVCPVEGAEAPSACAAPGRRSWERPASTTDTAAGRARTRVPARGEGP